MMTWPDDKLGEWKRRVADTLLRMAAALEQPVLMSCGSERDMDYVAARLPREDLVRLHLAASDDIWTRDYGPVTVLRDDEAVLLNFRFTGWGGRHPCQLDDSLSRRLHQDGAMGAAEMQDVELDCEGGGIDCDGKGHLLLRRQWLTAHGRNANSSLEEIERTLQELLGVECLWLDHGHITGDDTDDHVDMLARFAGEDVIVHASDSHNPELQAMQRQLRDINRQHGNRWELLPLQLPANCKRPASYVNFAIGNNAVLVPQYGQQGPDQEAMARIAECFPGRDAVATDATVLAEQGGGPHCATMNLCEAA